MFILLCMLSFALAEPPVGDSYLEAAQLNHDQISHQQYLPVDLTVPSTRTSESYNIFSNQYLPPNTRGISQKYGSPDTATRLSSEYGLPTRDTSIFRSGISQEYGTPIGSSSQYDLLNSDLNQSFSSILKSGGSQTYGVPLSRNSVSNLYSSPSQKSSPSQQYGIPQFHLSNEYTAHTSPVQKYGVPRFGSTQSRSKSISRQYGTPSNPQHTLGHSDGFSSILQRPQFQSLANYGTPARPLSSQYSTPSARNTITGFGGSARSSNSNTNAYASSYTSARSPSQEYGALTSRATLPSQEYGPPEASLRDHGYEYARNAIEILNQEPANYEFAYKVNDDDTGSDFGHAETRQLDRAEGAYFVLLPDGTKQIVEYEADEEGFKPRISVEPVDSATALAAEGPY